MEFSEFSIFFVAAAGFSRGFSHSAHRPGGASKGHPRIKGPDCWAPIPTSARGLLGVLRSCFLEFSVKAAFGKTNKQKNNDFATEKGARKPQL